VLGAFQVVTALCPLGIVPAVQIPNFGISFGNHFHSCALRTP